jgi:hypothetical protein
MTPLTYTLFTLAVLWIAMMFGLYLSAPMK